MAGLWMEIYTAVAFSRRPFGGNPASVCLLESAISDQLQQSIAAEMRHSETAFISVLPQKQIPEEAPISARQQGEEQTPEDPFGHGDSFLVRWFTPTQEVQLCGHGTLAAAAVIFQRRHNTHRQLHFHSRWGVLLTAGRSGDDELTLQLPLYVPRPVPATEFSTLLTAVCGQLEPVDTQLSKETGKLLVRLSDRHSQQELEQLQPDLEALTRLHDGSRVRGVIVTLLQGRPYDFVSRYFAPWVGIPEDPVTGSAHCVLAGYWSQQLGSSQLRARQCSARGGDMTLTVDEQRSQVKATAHAIVTLQGELRVE